MQGRSGYLTAAALPALLLCTMLVLRPTGAQFSGASVSAGNTAAAAQLQPPGTPAAAYSCSFTNRRITVTWAASPSTFATHYRVHKSTWNSGSASWGDTTLVATVAYGTNTWTDTSVAGSAQYRYLAHTIRSGTTWASADSAWSNIVSTPALCL